MSIYKELAFDHETDLVKRVQFSVMSPEEIQKRSVVEVTKNEIFIGADPVPNGLFDPRMGVIDQNKVCHTCEQKNTFCPGHFGHIILGKPVFYIQFQKTVEKILKCVCYRCGKLLVDLEDPNATAILNKKISSQKRWEAMFKLCSKNRKRCGSSTTQGCGAKQPDKIVKDGVIKIAMEWKESKTDPASRIVMNAEDVLTLLKRIPDADIEALGFSPKHNRPEWMVCTVLPVPPPSVRPSVRSDIGQRSEDDLTHKLANIIKANNQLKGKVDKGTKEQIDLCTQLLQYEVATFIDNQIPGIPPAMQRTGRPLRSLTERLKSKEGRIRGNLMGKRVDFSARSVITPDPCISIDELGVPIRIAMNLTFPEIVNPRNIQEMTKLVRNGPDIYPGAKFVRKSVEQRTIRLKGIDRSMVVLQNGDVVERHLRNGDVVLFNRQPSLHKMSMMAHRVRVMPYNTFRLNVCVTPAFNADFDGDEMNMHVPQSLQTHEELAQLAAVPLQIISPRQSKPIIAIVQDIVLGVFRMSKDHVRVPLKHFFNILSTNPRFLGDLPKAAPDGSGDTWTGKQLLSTIIPKNINTRVGGTVVENGELIKGIVDKSVYQAQSKGLVHAIYNDCSPEETRQFFDNTQRFVCDWLVMNGFSVGISDLIVDDETLTEFQNIITEMKRKVFEIMRRIHLNQFDNLSTKNNGDYFEQQVNNLLNEANGKVGKEGLGKINDLTNRLMNMIKSGSKGNQINVAQMIGCLGQQNVDGKRIPYGFDDRTLPHYTKYDDGPESRGFVQNSFIHGLTPQEFFFHSMGGREGLIDTAVKSVTGDTPIIVMEGGVCKYVQIGDWIDQHLEAAKDRVKHFEERQMEYLEMESLDPNDKATQIFIPTTDEDGRVSWGELTAVTRHDPGTELYQIKTAGGKSVIVTESKSLLTWNAQLGKFQDVPTPEIKVGDCVPVTASLAPPPVVIETVDIQQYQENGSPKLFVLNKNNGVFIGLFLAGGHVDIETGTVQISTRDIYATHCAIRWFDSFGINANMNEGERTTTVAGTSKWLAQFLHDFVGHDTRSVFVPSAAFAASEAFVVGILDGYVSGTDTWSVTSELMELCTSSQRMTEGIAMLCSRLGIFAEVDTIQQHRLSIRGQWASLFAKKVTLLVQSKNLQLQKMRCSATHPNFPEHHDVVLDKIVEINILDVAKYPKVYDVTVPSTLNFGLANGLQVRDTSDTGYIQRKLVKAMEDCKIHYDLTVRNATGSIVQFMYGEDGMDSSKIENQYIPYIEMDHATVRQEFHITRADLEAKKLEGILEADLCDALNTDAEEASRLLDNHFQQILEDRDYIIRQIFKSNQETSLQYPIAFQRILVSMQNLLAKQGCQSNSDLSPLYVLERIEGMCRDLRIHKNSADGSMLLSMLLRCHLSPKRVLVRHGLNRAAFDLVEQQIRARFYQSMAHPSEMVGVIAAQSIGEPTTQLTLNTFHMSGVSSASTAVRGVPRLRELLSVTKNMKTPIMNIYLHPPVRGSSSQELNASKQTCMDILNRIRTIRFKDLVKACKIYFDPDDFNTQIEDDRGFVQMYKAFADADGTCENASHWLLRLEFDRVKMLNHHVSMLDIQDALVNFYDDTVQCMFSDDNADRIILRIKLNVADAETCDDMLTELRALEHNLLEVVPVRGVHGIERASLHEETRLKYRAEDGIFMKQIEWVVDTDGSNLRDVLALSFVDRQRTTTNNVPEIYETLGIEAARNALYIEIMDVLESVGVNYRHVALLVDTMTNKGHLLSIDRHGINRGDIGPLAKCSFEEVTDMLVKAGMHAETDHINGVSANIMLGQIAPCGTGDTKILIDEFQLGELNVEAAPGEEQQDQHEEHLVTDACSEQSLRIQFQQAEGARTVPRKRKVEIRVMD